MGQALAKGWKPDVFAKAVEEHAERRWREPTALFSTAAIPTEPGAVGRARLERAGRKPGDEIAGSSHHP
jgi:hypothetical protein